MGSESESTAVDHAAHVARDDGKVLIITVWLGDLPSYFRLWLHGVRHNPAVNWLLATDAAVSEELPPNLTAMQTDAADIAARIRDRCDVDLSGGFTPYKICDFRPMFARVFAEHVGGYEFWAWGDMDVLYGDLTPIVLAAADFDVFGTGRCNRCSGPLCFFRNMPLLNSLYERVDVALLTDPAYRGVDEIVFSDLVKQTSCRMDLSSKEADPPARYEDGILYDEASQPKALIHFGGGGGVGRDVLREKNLVPSVLHVDLNTAICIDESLRVFNPRR